MRSHPYPRNAGLKRWFVFFTIIAALHAAASDIDAAKEALRQRLLEVEKVVPDSKPALRPLTDYAQLTYKRSWMQRWDNEARERIKPPLEPVLAWSAAVPEGRHRSIEPAR